MKKDNGITLIALVITIIVMLILVVVTVSFAMNGGLFEKAKDASSKYRAAQINEAIQQANVLIISDYYSDQLRTAPSASTVEGLVKDHLDGELKDAVSVSGSNGSYTVTVDSALQLVDREKLITKMEFDFWDDTATTSPTNP